MSQAPQSFPEIDQLREQRDAYVDHFRKTGQFQQQIAASLEQSARALVATSNLELKARATYELGTVLRLTGRFDQAIDYFQESASAAETFALPDLAFDAWIGIARAHAYGTSDHGKAAAAMTHAIRAAGSTPTSKQAYEIADYTAQLQSGRGELQAAMINALDAYRLAATPDQQFYADLGVGDVLQKFAESCDYHKLIDARSLEEDDPWGSCRRAVSSAEHYYELAREQAESLGWHFLASEASGFRSRLQPRLMIINSKAQFDTVVQPSLFVAQDVDDVIVNESFDAGASGITEYQVLGKMISMVASDDQSGDPRTQFLLGLQKDIEGKPDAALSYFVRAAELLARERSTLFDPRGRGTVIENRPELVRNLGLRLLAMKQSEAAFDAFESVRASGLSKLRAAITNQPLNGPDRALLADLVGMDARASGFRRKLVENTIAGIELDNAEARVEAIRVLEARRRELLSTADAQSLIKRLDSYGVEATTLSELQQAVKATGTTVAFYWVTATNVLVWFVSPAGMEVKTVFLPESAVNAKVDVLISSLRGPDKDYAATEAKELHTYLVKPFAHHLAGGKLLIVPQGPLTALPFEALIDATSNRYLVAELDVSYAPSATLAAQLLSATELPAGKVAVVFDPQIDTTTAEVEGLTSIDSLTVEKLSSAKATADQTIGFLSSAPITHVLLHGIFAEDDDPLMSYLDLNNPRLRGDDRRVTAAELLEVDWHQTNLAVFSACEGGRVTARISNEIHGMSWAPLVGGAAQVLVSRWRVNAASNGVWMGRFYGELAEGKPAASAASQAMREFVAGDRAHPHYWAGPQLYGR